ncbi:MAG: tyrosine-type recombinase/integrase [Candidatus Tectomicrobia bacterium]
MPDLHAFPHGHLLSDLSRDNQGRVAAYLTLLQARQYAPLTLDHILSALKSFCRLLPEPRRGVIRQDFLQTTPDDVDAWLHAAYAKGLAPSTMQSTLGTVRGFFTFLHTDGALPHHPIRPKRHEVNVPQHLPRPMAEADLVRFFQVIDVFRDRLMFLLMLRCGLRVGETARLRWDAIAWEQGALRIDNAKGAVDRVVYVSPDLEKALGQWRAIQPATDDYLFPSRWRRKAGQPVGRRLMQHLMTTYLDKAQITTGYSCHALRHTFATQLLNAGASLDVIKELMGHRSIDMVLRYAQLYESTKRQQYDHAMAQVTQRQRLSEGNR